MALCHYLSRVFDAARGIKIMTIIVNDNAINFMKFPGGECHVKLSTLDIGKQTEIFASLNNANDIMSLLLTVDAIRRINPVSEIFLTIPYFPYARHDRVCNEGEPLSVKVMADLINSLQCSKVTIYDPHSDVTPALLNRCNSVSLADIIAKSQLIHVIQQKNLVLLSPDAGAEKKIRTVAKKISKKENMLEVLCASKTRDTLTGNITTTQIHDDVNGRNFIILDDICDGGRTFIELAKLLRELNAGEIYLYVTHGIFSQGLNVLKDYFSHVFCYHTMLKPENIDTSFLTILGSNAVQCFDAKVAT